ncbi:hypothetical protein [Alcaligenes sp. SDU_A2]|uniref:hypothetical protein n=1 Tax=Alcaligenes sp. SDU_A2 TaxID=3136634 RepID=UPI00311D975E
MKSGCAFDQDWTAQVTLPVKRVGTNWEFLYGGDIPVKDGALGDLTINLSQITDENFRERVSAEICVQILEEGTLLLVALSDQSRRGMRLGRWPKEDVYSLPLGTTRLERITLGPPKRNRVEGQPIKDSERSGLWLKLKGLDRCELIGSTVLMPEGAAQSTATSLNHAFTLLSQQYETHRISNTGNVYSRVFYQERSGAWFPLNDLRMGVKVQGEKKLLDETWAEVERLLGWRPTIASKNKKTR